MYTFVDEMLDKRGPYRAEHLDLLKKMTKEGDCLIGEIPTLSPRDDLCSRYVTPNSKNYA